MWSKLFVFLKPCCFLVINQIKYLTSVLVGIWEPVFETQKVYLYKYFCILLAFRILSPETISVIWNFHSSWQKLPSGFCSWHSTKLPGEVTEDTLSCQILWLPLCGRWHADHLLKSLICWFSLSFVCGVRALCLAWVRFWGHEDEWDIVFTLQEIIPSRGNKCMTSGYNEMLPPVCQKPV